MIGAVLVVVFIVIVFPLSIMMSGAVLSAVLGTTATRQVEGDHEGSELIELSR